MLKDPSSHIVLSPVGHGNELGTSRCNAFVVFPYSRISSCNVYHFICEVTYHPPEQRKRRALPALHLNFAYSSLTAEL